MLKPNLNHDKLTLFAGTREKLQISGLFYLQKIKITNHVFNHHVFYRCDRAVGIESHNSFFNERLHHAAQCLNQDTGFYKQLS